MEPLFNKNEKQPSPETKPNGLDYVKYHEIDKNTINNEQETSLEKANKDVGEAFNSDLDNNNLPKIIPKTIDSQSVKSDTSMTSKIIIPSDVLKTGKLEKDYIDRAKKIIEENNGNPRKKDDDFSEEKIAFQENLNHSNRLPKE